MLVRLMLEFAFVTGSDVCRTLELAGVGVVKFVVRGDASWPPLEVGDASVVTFC